jgi:hypothetical protein
MAIVYKMSEISVGESAVADLINFFPADGKGPHVTFGIGAVPDGQSFAVEYHADEGRFEAFVTTLSANMIRVVLAHLNRVSPSEIEIRPLVLSAAA